jgi:capsular polysaccharide biosynthesis protein
MTEEMGFSEEIDLRDLLSIFLKRIGWIIGGAIVGGVLALLFTMYAVTPSYESNTTMMVNGSKTSIGDIASGFDLGSLNLSQKLVITYSEIVKSRIVLESVIERMDLDMSYTQLLNSISASPVNNTEILKITVHNGDPELAADIANMIADVFIKEVMRILQVSNVEVIDAAIPMPMPTNVRPLMNIAIGIILGVMFVVFIVFLIEFLDQSVKTEDDVARYIDLPVIGSIIDFDSVPKK